MHVEHHTSYVASWFSSGESDVLIAIETYVCIQKMQVIAGVARPNELLIL